MSSNLKDQRKSVHIINNLEDVHLTLPPHIISVRVKPRSMLYQGSVGVSLQQKQNKRNLTLTPNVLLPSIVFHNKI